MVILTIVTEKYRCCLPGARRRLLSQRLGQLATLLGDGGGRHRGGRQKWDGRGPQVRRELGGGQQNSSLLASPYCSLRPRHLVNVAMATAMASQRHRVTSTASEALAALTYRVRQWRRPHYKNCNISETARELHKNFLGYW